MATRITHQTVCDRCEKDMGDPVDFRPEEGEHIVLVEAPDLGFPLKAMSDICSPCLKLLPSLLEQVVSVPKKKTKSPKRKEKKS